MRCLRRLACVFCDHPQLKRVHVRTQSERPDSGFEIDGRTINSRRCRRPNGAALVKPEADDIAEAEDQNARQRLGRIVAASFSWHLRLLPLAVDVQGPGGERQLDSNDALRR